MPSPAAKFTPLGPGTITIGTAPFDFSCEVRGGSVTHAYDTEDAETMLCGTITPGAASRSDGLTFSLYNDLGTKGLYKYLMDHDLEVVDFTYTPNTADQASWAGSIRLTLPESIGADAFGANIGSEVTWEGASLFTFTPTPAPSN